MLLLSLSFYEWVPLPPQQQGSRCRRMGSAHLISCFNKLYLTEPLPGSLLKPCCTLICIKHKRLQLIDPCSLSIWGHSDIVWAAALSRFFTCHSPPHAQRGYSPHWDCFSPTNLSLCTEVWRSHYSFWWQAVISGIDLCGVELVLDGVESNDRKEERTGRPYLEAPGCCDGKWNVRRGKRN